MAADLGSGCRASIAVVGIGCRFPGGVRGPRSFWQALRDGVDAIGPIPEDRFDAKALYGGPRPTPGRLTTRWGGFLDGIDRFDPLFFGISPREAERLDPQHRLLLETAWDALEDGAHSPARLEGVRTGVWVGLWTQDYEALLSADARAADLYTTLGAGRYSASGRVSHTFGFQGPSITIDTASSSSLVAVHQACRSLWAGECDAAVAGGANVILRPDITLAYSASGMMAPDGRCKFGDARADGFVRSEGAAMVFLKPLPVAIAQGDPVWAVIHGSAVNHDGRTGEHFVLPSPRGQEDVLRLAWDDAGRPPGAADYIEAHGTGTAAGDRVELAALGAVVGAAGTRERPCWVGSVKSNIGHTEAAAGVAGLIKVALMVHHRHVVRNLHHETPHPDVAWERSGLRVATQEVDLDPNCDLLAGVSSFGISGTNAHVVVGSPPRVAGPRALSASKLDAHAGTSEVVPVVLLLSAHDGPTLRALAGDTAAWLTAIGAPEPQSIARSLATRRARHEHRLAVVARSIEAARGDLVGFHRKGALGAATVSGTAPRTMPPEVVWVFTGEGAHRIGRARSLRARYAVVRQTLLASQQAMPAGVDWSLDEQLGLDEGDVRWVGDRPDVAESMAAAVGIALAALWRSWGLRPDAVMGRGAGDVAAAWAVGALRLSDAMRVVYERSPSRAPETEMPFFSTVAGAPIEEDRADTENWVQGKVGAAAWAATAAEIARAARDRGRRAVFLALDAHGELTSARDEWLPAPALPGMGRATGGDGEPDDMLHHAMGALWVKGVELDWEAVLGAGTEGQPAVRFPPYPWQKDRHWYEVGVAEPLAAPLLAAAESPDRATEVVGFLRTRIASVLRLRESAVAGTHTFRSLGMDSLMMLELRDRIEAELGLALPVTDLWNYPTLDLLAAHVAHRMDTDATASVDDPPRSASSPSLDEIGGDDLDAVFNRELADLEELLGGP